MQFDSIRVYFEFRNRVVYIFIIIDSGSMYTYKRHVWKSRVPESNMLFKPDAFQ